MFKDFLLRKMIEKQLKGVSKEDQEKLINLVSNNPELFQKIAIEVKAKGGDVTAAMEVVKNYEKELKW